MPVFTFDGFSPGAKVVLAATQGLSVATNTALSWGDNALGSLTIQEVRSTSKIAPASCYFHASLPTGFSTEAAPAGTAYIPELHEITYIWTIRGAPLNLETSQALALNMPDAWKNPNVAYGPDACFTFNDAATYHVDLLAVDRDGNKGVATYEVVVGDADAAFSGSQTICYSESDFAGAPSGATQVVSRSSLNSAIATAGSVDLRILFRAGDSIDLGGQINATSATELSFGSFGSGARPIMSLRPATGANGHSDHFYDPPRDAGIGVKLYDLEFAGGWDAAEERGIPGRDLHWRDHDIAVSYHRCGFTGMDGLSHPLRDTAGGNTLFSMNECSVTNWQNIGIYLGNHNGGDRYASFAFTSVFQDVDAAQGTSGATTFANNLGPIRISGDYRVAMRGFDAFSRNGWSAGNSEGYNSTADQPCLRLNSAVNADARYTLDRVACEGGYQSILLKDAGSKDALAGNYVFDKILTVGSPETNVHILSEFGGLTIRNWLAVETNVKKNSYGLQDGFGTFGVRNVESNTANTDSPVSIYNSTGLSLISTANLRNRFSVIGNDNVEHLLNGDSNHRVSDTEVAFTNFTDENNVFHAPNQDTPDTGDAPIDTATGITGFTPRFKGALPSLPFIRYHTLSGAVADTGTLSIAYADLLDENGSATDQIYWQGRGASDDLDSIYVADVGYTLHANEGDFTVAFGASDVTITNTSGVVWANGSVYTLRLDRYNLWPAMDTTYSTTGQTIPTAALTSNSPAAVDGWIAEDTFDMSPRTGRHIPGAGPGTPKRGAA